MNPVWRIARFVGVGCLAAAVHWAVVVGLVEAGGLAPVVANPFGWLVAFAVSLAGHRRLTFADRRVPLARAARRLFLLSAAGFALNEAAYACLLRLGDWDYRPVLAVVLVAVAVVTYLASRAWAFAEGPTDGDRPR